MFTKNIVSPYHHTLLSTKKSYKIIFSNAKSFYLELGSYLNVYVSFHIHFIYKYKYIVVKLYLNLSYFSGNSYILVGRGLSYCYLRPRIQKVISIPVVPIFHQYPITFVIILNIHFLNYFVLSCAYAREPSCNNLNLTFSDRLSLVFPISQWLFLKFCRQDNILRVNLHSP